MLNERETNYNLRYAETKTELLDGDALADLRKHLKTALFGRKGLAPSKKALDLIKECCREINDLCGVCKEVDKSLTQELELNTDLDVDGSSTAFRLIWERLQYYVRFFESLLQNRERTAQLNEDVFSSEK